MVQPNPVVAPMANIVRNTRGKQIRRAPKKDLLISFEGIEVRRSWARPLDEAGKPGELVPVYHPDWHEDETRMDAAMWMLIHGCGAFEPWAPIGWVELGGAVVEETEEEMLARADAAIAADPVLAALEAKERAEEQRREQENREAMAARFRALKARRDATA